MDAKSWDIIHMCHEKRAAVPLLNYSTWTNTDANTIYIFACFSKYKVKNKWKKKAQIQFFTNEILSHKVCSRILTNYGH